MLAKETYRSAQCKNALRHLRNVFLFKQIDGLEHIGCGHTVGFDSLLERVDILHDFERHRGVLVYLLHATWFNLVDQSLNRRYVDKQRTIKNGHHA